MDFGQNASAARRGEIAANLDAVRARIDRAASLSGRAPEAVTLVAVTKGFPASDIEHLIALGVTDIGENKDQEARVKLATLEARREGALRVHFIGQLQTNKCRSVVRYTDMVQTVDRVELVAALHKACVASDRRISVLLQVNLDHEIPVAGEQGGPHTRGGATPERVDDLAGSVASAADRLELAGLMAVAPLNCDPVVAFDRLYEISTTLRRAYPTAQVISAGMSGDFELAIERGATHIRVGSALLGHR